jgi:hypothetical protein
MASELETLPGNVRRAKEPAEAVKPDTVLTSVAPLLERPTILICTASISDSNLFNNGLYQNCFLIYRLAEAIGWLPILVVNAKPKTLEGIPEMLRTCRIAEVDDIFRNPIPVRVYLEIGMSLSSQLRRLIRMLGARTCKLYLGNILNIDIETPMFSSHQTTFSHHVVGEQDEIWTSPHYLMNLEYAACLNTVEPEPESAKIAPYVWDPCILTDDGRRHVSWKTPSPGEKPTFLIMEPNISFQKTSILPLWILEEYARKYPDRDFQVVVLNSERLGVSAHYKSSVEPNLRCLQGKIQYAGRHDILTIMKNYPSAYPVCHHFTNEYNYMVLEFLYAGYPVLHNCRAWKDFGYFYGDNDIAAGAQQLNEAVKFHHERLEIYKSHSRALAWRHSIYNPDVQHAWKKLLENN